MPRSGRLFEIIQILRRADAPLRAEDLAAELEVSKRTVYRDIATLQMMRTPIEGEAGVGYVLRGSYDLPPLNFDTEELEALHVGLRMLLRTGDGRLQQAAERVSRKINDVHGSADWLQVAPWGAPRDDAALGCVSLADLREAIRSSRRLRLSYLHPDKGQSDRVVRPLALVYHIDCTLLAAWCELRGGFRHFRADRMVAAELLEDSFAREADVLRGLWQQQESEAFGLQQGA
ncbi:YafY family protein [Phaeobacter sp.]|uniref:helix-turn-helix transcriptional regulator n=1 Tax=Phaeobacter sp. TaxID=1902409 RepID=UPI0025F9E10A|nr:YafY family protein [Phaeobacter sp.]